MPRLVLRPAPERAASRSRNEVAKNVEPPEIQNLFLHSKLAVRLSVSSRSGAQRSPQATVLPGFSTRPCTPVGVGTAPLRDSATSWKISRPRDPNRCTSGAASRCTSTDLLPISARLASEATRVWHSGDDPRHRSDGEPRESRGKQRLTCRIDFQIWESSDRREASQAG